MNNRKQRGFTLVELIVVLAILAILLVVLVPKFTHYIDDARATATRNDASALLQAAELYVIDQERNSAIPQATITQADDTLKSYLKNTNASATYQINIVPDAANGYNISGHYSSGKFTVSLPALTLEVNNN